MAGALDRSTAKMAGLIAEEDRENSVSTGNLFAPRKFRRHVPA